MQCLFFDNSDQILVTDPCKSLTAHVKCHIIIVVDIWIKKTIIMKTNTLDMEDPHLKLTFLALFKNFGLCYNISTYMSTFINQK